MVVGRVVCVVVVVAAAAAVAVAVAVAVLSVSVRSDYGCDSPVLRLGDSAVQP